MITDTSGNQLAGARITAVVNAKALRGKTATSFTVTTVANGHFTIPNVPVVNVVNGNGPLGTGTFTGGALTLSVEAPAGYFGATALVFPQAQTVSSEGGGLIQGGDTNPQLIWFDHFNADAGTIQLPATIATITGILRNANTGAAISGFPMRLTFEQVQPDQYGQGTVVCSDPSDATCRSPVTSVVVTYASGNEQRIQTESAGTGTIAGRFFFTNVPADSCVRIYAPGLNWTDVNGGTGQDFGGAVCDDQDEANSISYLAISTNDDFVQLNRVFATESETRDTIPPVVASVGNAGSATTGACFGQTSGSATFTSAQGDIVTVFFSEPVNIDLALLENNPVVVLVGNPPNVTSAEVESVAAGADGRSLIIDLAEDVPQASQVRVQIPVEAVTDFSTPPNNLAEGPLGFDDLIQTINNGSVENQVLSLCFNVFGPNPTPGPLTVAQVDEVVNEDTLLFQSSHALADMVETDAAAPDGDTLDENGDVVATPDFEGIDQINGPDQDGSVLVLSPDPSDELTDLAAALDPTLTPAEAEVINTTARVRITQTNSTSIIIALQDPVTQRAKDVGFWPTNGATVEAVVCEADVVPCVVAKQLPLAVSNGGLHWYVIDPNGATTFDVIIAGQDTSGAFSENVSDGDLVHVIARDANGVLVATADTPVFDNVVPGPVLQLLGQSNSVTPLTEFGEGGTVVINQASDTGTVVLPITPQIADKIDNTFGNATGYSSDTYIPETYTPSGLAAAGIPNTGDTDSRGNVRADTDATGMAVFLGPTGASRNDVTAIAVSEEVELTGAAFPAYTGNAVLSNFEVHNHTATEDFPSVTGSVNDLVEFNVDNVFTLQADARDNANQLISLEGAIQDTTVGPANVADETAVVVLRDKFPPMVVLAFFDGTNIVIVFNEPVLLSGIMEFQCVATELVDLTYVSAVPTTAQISQNAAAINGFEAGSVVTIPGENFAEQTGVQPGTCFSNNPDFAYDEAAYSNLAAGLTDLADIAVPQRHGYISWRGVQDTQGNVWDCGLGGTLCTDPVGFDWAADPTNPLGIGAPRFAMADILGPFQPILSVASGNFTTSAGGAVAGETINYNVEFSHPVFITNGPANACSGDNFGDDADANCDGTVTNAELLNFVRQKFELAQVDDPNPDIIVQPSAVQIRDSTGADILVNGDINDARRFFITFILVQDPEDGDRIRMISGSGVTSLLDDLQNVRPFDEGDVGAPNSDPGQTAADGDNNTNELQELPPFPLGGEHVCPQQEFGGPELDQC